MVDITFSRGYNSAPSTLLKKDLQDLFNDKEVKSILQPVSKKLFPNGDTNLSEKSCFSKGYGFNTIHLNVFNNASGVKEEEARDAYDPRDLCIAIFDVYKQALQIAGGAKLIKNSGVELILEQSGIFLKDVDIKGLESVCRKIIAVCEKQRARSDLKNDILNHAHSANLEFGRKK